MKYILFIRMIIWLYRYMHLFDVCLCIFHACNTLIAWVMFLDNLVLNFGNSRLNSFPLFMWSQSLLRNLLFKLKVNVMKKVPNICVMDIYMAFWFTEVQWYEFMVLQNQQKQVVWHIFKTPVELCKGQEELTPRLVIKRYFCHT